MADVNQPSGSNEFPVGSNPTVTNASAVNPVPLQQPQQQASAPAKSSNGSGLGSVVGGLLGTVGKAIFGGLFAKGGPVGYAEGGPTGQSDPSSLIGLGYLVGALHQAKFDGTPKTLKMAVQAAQDILNRDSKDQSFASGGEVNNPQNQGAVTAALMQALGGGTGTTTNTNPNTLPAPNATPTNAPELNASSTQFGGSPVSVLPPQTMLNMQEGANSGNYQDQSVLNYLQKNSNQTQPVSPPPKVKKGGYMDNVNETYNEGPVAQPQLGYAAGGSPQQQDNTPMLKPGQTFQGDGSVKGPGTATSDSIPARLSNGEFVMSEPAVKFWGVQKLSQMNEKGKQGFMEQLSQVQANQQPGQQQGQTMPPVPGAAAQSAQSPQQAQQAPDQTQGAGLNKGGVPIRNTNKGFMGL